MHSATLLEYLVKEFPTAKRLTLKKMVSSGRVRINGVVAKKLSQAIGQGDRIEILGREKRHEAESEPAFGIVFEDRDILVIDKPAGLLSSSGPREKRATALGLAREYVARKDRAARVGLVHRLDREASGLLVFSKNAKAHESLKRQFFQHSAGRIYLALVSPAPEPTEGKIESHLVERADGTVHSTQAIHRRQRAISHYLTIEVEGNVALVRVKLETGRKHQIRVHLSERGWPIVGDEMYGGRAAAGLMLAAVELQLDHPRTGERKTFRVEMPERFLAGWKKRGR